MTETKDLVIVLEGGVVKSNLSDYEKKVNGWIDSINKELVTDEHFAQADQDVKAAKDIEAKLHNTRQEALSQLGDVFDLMTTLEQWQERIRQQVRLPLEKLIKEEKENRKSEVVNKAVTDIEEAISASPVAHLVNVNRVAINEATKRKKSIEKMKEAIEQVVGEQVQEINKLAARYEHNFKAIEKIETEYPGLFPDKKTVAGGDPQTVEATIESRVNTFKLKQKEKEEAERKAKEEAKAQKDTEQPPPPEPHEPAKQKHHEPAPKPVEHRGNCDFVLSLTGEGCRGALTICGDIEYAKTVAKAIHGGVSALGVNVELKRS